MPNEIQKRVKVTNPTYLYQKNSENEKYRSKMTNFDETITEMTNKRGYVTAEERQKVQDGADAEIFKLLREEHIKVVEFAEKTSTSLKKAMKMAGVATVSALYKFIEEARSSK